MVNKCLFTDGIMPFPLGYNQILGFEAGQPNSPGQKNLNLNLHPAVLEENASNQILSAKKLNSTIGASHQENFTDTINQPYGPNRDATGNRTKEFSETDY